MKEARIEKRKARWKARWRRRRRSERARGGGGCQGGGGGNDDRSSTAARPAGDSSPSPPRAGGAGAVSVPLDFSARGAAKAEGWHWTTTTTPPRAWARSWTASTWTAARTSAWLGFACTPRCSALQGARVRGPADPAGCRPASGGSRHRRRRAGSGGTLAFGLPILNRLLRRGRGAVENPTPRPDGNDDPRPVPKTNRSLGEPGGGAEDGGGDPAAALAGDRGARARTRGTRLSGAAELCAL